MLTFVCSEQSMLCPAVQVTELLIQDPVRTQGMSLNNAFKVEICISCVLNGAPSTKHHHTGGINLTL